MHNPKLIVFDLDFTLWDCGGTWCDCLCPPFAVQDGRIVDQTGRRVRLYEDVDQILAFCDEEAVPYAVASRTEQPEWARELLGLLQITERFTFSEIYPASKVRHFSSLRGDSGLAYSEMLFFDDEMRNIREVSDLGVTSVFVDDGMTGELFQHGLEMFSRQS